MGYYPQDQTPPHLEADTKVNLVPRECFGFAVIPGGIEIKNYRRECGSEVEIPNEIAGKKVLEI